MTNLENIRTMNLEDLAIILCELRGMCFECIAEDFCEYGKNGFIEWLKQEAEHDSQHQNS